MEAVALRLKSLLERLENAHQGTTVLLVAHGDTLSILTAVAHKTPLGEHSQTMMQTGELRQLKF